MDFKKSFLVRDTKGEIYTEVANEDIKKSELYIGKLIKVMYGAGEDEGTRILCVCDGAVTVPSS